MTTIRTTCRCCDSDVEIDSATAVLAVAEDGSGELLYDCPVCAAPTVQALNPSEARLLRVVGMPHLPLLALDALRPPYPETRPAGGPLGPDDLLELHELLARDDWAAALTR